MSIDKVKETFKIWLEKHRNDYFANNAVGVGCFNFHPYDVAWAVTKQCNLKCQHCSIDATTSNTKDNELSTEEGFSFIDDVAKLGPVKFVFTGGELFVRNDIFELIEHAASYDMMIEVATNGTLINDSVAKRLKDIGVYEVAISMDGNESIHDNFRGVNGTYNKAVNAIKACKKAGLMVHFHTTMSKMNLKELPNIIELAERFQADRIYIGALIAVGRGNQISDSCLSAKEMKDIFKFVVEQQPKTPVWLRPVCPQFWAFLKSEGLSNDDKDHKFVGCTAGISSFHIRPNGDVSFCAELPLQIGNVRKKPFSTIIKEAEIFERAKKRDIKGKCADCKYLNACGGCRARAFAASGDLFAEDPVCFLNCKN